LEVSKTPALQPGKVGLFDDSGVSLGCIVNYGDKKYLYYMGWNLGVTVPWRKSIGLAISDNDGNSFVSISRGPLIDRHDLDPYSLSYPWVLRENGCWRLWYGSNLSWGESPEDMKHVIKFASSKDGINWERTGRICIGSENQTEIGFSRPCVMKHGYRYYMWYSYRQEAYRIGYAESDDGVQWIRKDEQVGIAPSKRGWDSECVCYCHVFEHKSDYYMLYAGNGYGRDGFGVAKGKPCE
ncbi:MAG: hypothetical protein ACREBC_35300, partial [Pyrinomonadaceae bacterium]